jgi:nucleotide-binding universal stress UspA family protein
LAAGETYEVIKAVPPPVLVAIGAIEKIKRILVCTGGRRYIDDAVQLAGEIAKCIGGTVTLLHVMAEPPAIYADLVRLEEDVDSLLASNSELGRNLRGQKESLEKMGLNVEVRIRHGLALDQIFDEVREGKHDLIVTGTSQARGPLRHYIMGDLTRGILNRADCPVLVARAGKIVDHEDAEGGFFHRLLHGFGAPKSA